MFNDKDVYNDPVISKRRKGTSDDPFLFVTETLQVENGRVILSEIPNRMNKVKAESTHNNWREELRGGATENKYKVDYTEGVVFFDSSHNGKSITFSYLGEGVHLFPSQRVYIEENGLVIGIKDKFKQVDVNLNVQKERVDEQIRSVPQPSEVVDQRIDLEGNVFRTAKDRIDAEQRKINEASIDFSGKQHESLRDRINSEEIKLDEATRDLNNNKYPTLKERLDGDQKRVMDTLTDGSGTKYPSLSERLNSIDDDISIVDRRIVDNVSTLKGLPYLDTHYVSTRGYYKVNDGGGAVYKISDKPTKYGEKLNNGLYAHIVTNGIINPKQFGADATGIEDAATSIQLALDYVNEQNGGIVQVTSGKYLLKSSLVISKNTSLYSDEGTTYIRAHSSYMIMNGKRNVEYTGYDGNGNIIISGGVWDAKGMSFETGGTAFAIGHCENILIENVEILDVVNTHAIELNSTKNGMVDNCRFLGFRLTNGRSFSEAINIDKATAAGFPAFGKYDNTACDNITIQNCRFGKSKTLGISGYGRGVGTHSADQAAGGKHARIVVRDNLFESTLEWAIYATHWDDSEISGNKIFNCGGGIKVTTANQSMFKITVSENLIDSSGFQGLANISFQGTEDYELRSMICTDNIIYSVASESVSGIYAAYCNGCKIDGNSIRNTNTHAIMIRYGRYYQVVNNSIVSCAGSGIYVWTNVLYSNIVNNQIGYVGLHGIHVTNNVDSIIVSSNVIAGINGNATNDANHIRVTDLVQRISLLGNVCRDIQTRYIASRALYITNTCYDVTRTGNMFKGISGGISDGSGSMVTGDLV
ncbi:hypothetical protein FZC83_02445 [Rossellomorea marisflavi]|uniref:Right handed beta helix domain-containing protein n=1 Tax=Rossellomorea marisflavi TaxID=189381 RepID=A0A5D4S2W5_9BACI|nr:right-handed parallel beta-helix repeat-containing protein [Rossellomorea marisflavi]TYS56454.1 hypothetical protein FZC83_02445 [Rossellomorea marisflavi]